MQIISLFFLVSLAQVASFFTSLHTTTSRSAVSKRFLFGNPEPSKSPAKKEEKGGMFGGEVIVRARILPFRALLSVMLLLTQIMMYHVFRNGQHYGSNEEGTGNCPEGGGYQQGTNGNLRSWIR